MNEEALKELALKAAAIAGETADALKRFPKEISMLLYAKQSQGIELNTTFPEGTVHNKKMNNDEASQKIEKMLKDARLKWKYASESDKRKVLEMEKIVLASDEKIRALYAGLAEQY